MVHLWMRAEQRANERRFGLTPEGAGQLLKAGFQVSVEESASRAMAAEAYRQAGCEIVKENSWPEAPRDAIIFGLKELPDDGTPLPHRHIMFGHAYKGQPDGQRLLKRFKAGGGTLYDLEYLVDANGRRVSAFGYWAGFAGAAVTIKCWASAKVGGLCGPVAPYESAEEMVADVAAGLELSSTDVPRVIVIGALGRVGTGARDLCQRAGIKTTNWDIEETRDREAFPEIFDHDIFLNCILAMPGCPVFVPANRLANLGQLSAIGDIACDPTSEFSPIKVYDRVTTWNAPALRVSDDPILDVMAIDNLPSLLPRESSEDFAGQLLPYLGRLNNIDTDVWGRAAATFKNHLGNV